MMNSHHLSQFYFSLLSFTLVILLLPTPCISQVFDVTNVEEFRAALIEAQQNGQDDIVNVAEGNYAPTTYPITYHAIPYVEAKALTIQGAGPDKSIIDGSNIFYGLRITTSIGSFDDTTATIVLRDIGIKSGLSGTNGGGFYIRTYNASVSVENVVIESNESFWDGGGAYVASNQGEVLIDRLTATANKSGGGGGGVYIYTNVDITVIDSVFENNIVTSDNSGGGLNAKSASGGTIIVKDCRFHGNKAIYTNALAGGAYIETWTNGNAIFINNTLSGNSSEYAGGVYINGGPMVIANNTLSGNHAIYHGGGMLFEMQGGTAYVGNNIVWGNTAAGVGDDIYVEDGNPSHVAILTNNDYSDLAKIGGGDVQEETTNINLDPKFVAATDPDPAKWNLHLTAGSGAIDSGDNTFITVDIPTDRDGDNRIIDGNSDGAAIVDMGSDEYVPVSIPPVTPPPSDPPPVSDPPPAGGGGGGGCSLGSRTEIDPLFPLMLLIGMAYLARCRDAYRYETTLSGRGKFESDS